MLDIGEGERRKKVQLHTRIDRKSDYAVETGKTLSENIILSTGNPQNISPTIAPLLPPATQILSQHLKVDLRNNWLQGIFNRIQFTLILFVLVTLTHPAKDDVYLVFFTFQN